MDLNQLVDKIGFESSGCNVVPADVSLEVHVVGGDLGWELEIAALRCCLLRVLASIFLLQSGNSLIKNSLKDGDGLDRAANDVLAESGVELAHFINVHMQSGTSSYDVLDSFSHLSETHQLSSSILHVSADFVCIGFLCVPSHGLRRTVDLIVHCVKI